MIKLRMLETAETEQFRYGSSFSDALTASLKPIILFLWYVLKTGAFYGFYSYKKAPLLSIILS